ncbi:MAG: histidinol-phosphate transaminase [Oscillospiraceae bacterium]|nr:histidinol-phosphate transaminase [Oscillospiraceae bacterium]
MSEFLSKNHAGLAAYVPGEQPTGMEYIKLNTNESPYPPPPSVLTAVTKETLGKLRLYPNPDGTELIKKLAGTYGVRAENIIIGNGSDELLAFAFLAFCDKTRGVAFPDLTYGFYPVYAQLYGIPYEEIPLRDDFTVNFTKYMELGKNIVIANPNAPTGIALPLFEIQIICQSNPGHIVLIDEAYVDFGAESAVSLIGKHENLIVMHTFSKSRSMAGARMAYAIASAPIIEDLNKMKYSFNPYNVNRLTQIMAEAALGDESYFAEKRREIIATRSYTAAKLGGLGFEMTDSKANFIFARHPEISGLDLYTKLKEKGILIRHWDKPRIKDYVRITIGTKDQMDALIVAVEQILFSKY